MHGFSLWVELINNIAKTNLIQNYRKYGRIQNNKPLQPLSHIQKNYLTFTKRTQGQTIGN